MPIYLWRFLEWRDPYGEDLSLGLHLAACDPIALVEEITGLGPDATRAWQLSPLPRGCPRHLDFPGEVIKDRTESFQTVSVQRVSDSDRIEAIVNDHAVLLRVGGASFRAFTQALVESQVMGYFADTFVSISLADDQPPRSSTLYVWSCLDTEVIYY